MESKLVSVIMPAHNGEKYIKQAIESVLAQTYSNWELIVVDDGSTDNTARVVSSLIDQDKRIIYIYQENCGQAATLNRGLDVARGEYITTLDVDDWFTINSLEDRTVFLDNNLQYDVVYGDGIFCDLSGNELKRFSEMRLGEVVGDVFDVLLSNAFFGTGSNVMVRRSVLEKFNIRYDASIVWCQDYDFYLRLAEKCQFGYVDSLIVWYRLHVANMTMTMSADRRRESLVRTKLKALNSARFGRVQRPDRYLFFQFFLLHDLENRIEDQIVLLNHLEFLRMPKSDRAMLTRQLALGYLSANKKMREVKSLVKRSWALNPFDPKTVFLIFLAYFNVGPIVALVRYWQEMKLRRSFEPSPFYHIKE